MQGWGDAGRVISSLCVTTGYTYLVTSTAWFGADLHSGPRVIQRWRANFGAVRGKAWLQCNADKALVVCDGTSARVCAEVCAEVCADLGVWGKWKTQAWFPEPF